MIRRFHILILLLSINAYSQNSILSIYPNLGVDVGGAIPFPFSDIPEDAGGTPKPYPTLGLGVNYEFNEEWSLSLECNYHLIAFSAKATVRSQPINNDDGTTVLYFTGETKADVELRQVEFPLSANYKVGENWYVIFGGYYSRILEGTFYTEGKNGVLSNDRNITDNAILPGTAPTQYDFNDKIDKWDAGIMIGYRYNISQKLFFWAKFHVGFKSIFQKDFKNIDYEMYQLRLSAGISYKLFTFNRSE
ncbi:MAG: outer membrane beta-barrel protein [Bacteroidales bacterium]|nr:outer membrane beta-barrel protein [Bacteroidales bacterium]